MTNKPKNLVLTEQQILEIFDEWKRDAKENPQETVDYIEDDYAEHATHYFLMLAKRVKRKEEKNGS